MLQSRRKHEFVLASFFIEQKKEELVRKHGMKMTVSLERRLEKMCNLSENLIEKGEERGREAGIIALVKSLKSLDHSTEVILEQLMQNFDLSEEKAKSYL